MATTPRSRVCNLALTTTAALLAELLLWQLTHTGSAWRGAATVVLALPALLVLASLLRHRPHARAWNILGAIPYVILGITELIANPGERAWALACAILAFFQFVVIAWLLRIGNGSD